MVLPAWRTTANNMASNDVRCLQSKNGKQNKQQLAEMAGNSAFLFKYMPIWKRNEAATTIYSTDRGTQSDQV